MKNSERMRELVEVARTLKNDQTETGKLARKILGAHREFVRSEKRNLK
jgi:hypothetical protein